MDESNYIAKDVSAALVSNGNVRPINTDRVWCLGAWTTYGDCKDLEGYLVISGDISGLKGNASCYKGDARNIKRVGIFDLDLFIKELELLCPVKSLEFVSERYYRHGILGLTASAELNKIMLYVRFKNPNNSHGVIGYAVDISYWKNSTEHNEIFIAEHVKNSFPKL